MIKERIVSTHEYHTPAPAVSSSAPAPVEEHCTTAPPVLCASLAPTSAPAVPYAAPVHAAEEYFEPALVVFGAAPAPVVQYLTCSRRIRSATTCEQVCGIRTSHRVRACS